METITKPDSANTTYSHTYELGGVRTIGMSGQATKYSSGWMTAAISFASNTNIAGIDGSLGATFGTLTSEQIIQPQFYKTFTNCTNLVGTIPENLFAGEYYLYNDTITPVE